MGSNPSLSALSHPVVAVDPAGLTARVRAGMVWKDLEAELKGHGLARRLYPTSAPSVMVGGWLAQGGVGIGSHPFGWFRNNVVSARVVGGDAQIRVVEGTDLVGIVDAEGTTGIITEVTLRVRLDTAVEQLAISFGDATNLAAALKALSAAELPIWSVSFINPTMAKMKNAGPPKTHQGHPIFAQGPLLPEDSYLLIAAYDVSDRPTIWSEVGKIADAHQGKRQSVLIANHEWEERYKPHAIEATWAVNHTGRGRGPHFWAGGVTRRIG